MTEEIITKDVRKHFGFFCFRSLSLVPSEDVVCGFVFSFSESSLLTCSEGDPSVITKTGAANRETVPGAGTEPSEARWREDIAYNMNT
jgi:hypothetical protein